MFNFFKNRKKENNTNNQNDAHKYENKVIKFEANSTYTELNEFDKKYYVETKYDVSKLENILLTNSNEKMLSSFLEKIITESNPSDLKMVCIEYLRMSFLEAKGIPHLLAPVITDSKRVNIV